MRGYPRTSRRQWRSGLAVLGLAAGPGIGQAQSIQQGSQVPNYIYPEVGVSALPGNSSGAPGGGAASGPSTPTGGGSSGITSTGSNSLTNMEGQAWGLQAAQNSQIVGVNPDALAATCMVESGCQNLNTAKGSNTITGAFQMSNGTYQQMMQEAVTQNPSLAGTIDTSLAGQNDPASQAVAAAQYMKDGANYLEANGISNPTALDVRGYYNFGPQRGDEIATSSPDAPMSNFLPANVMASNGITPGETVGQWKQASANKMGTGSSSPVLPS